MARAVRRAAFDRHGWAIPPKTCNPELAQRNLLERDRMFTDRRFDETKRLDLPVLEIDYAINEDELTGQAQAFGL
jgi:hypothetical protein